MKALLNKLLIDPKWFFIKLSMAVFFCRYCDKTLQEITSISSEKGLCAFIDCQFTTLQATHTVLWWFIVLLLILYVCEKQMKVVTFLLFASSFLIFSAHESFGVQNRTGILVLIWLVQCIAYWMTNLKATFDLQKNRVFYPVQVIVACYTLSALSKLANAGFSWFTNNETVALQLIKSQQTYVLDGEIEVAANLSYKIELIQEFPTLLSVLLCGAMLIELSAGLALLSNKMRLLYGILLFCLHLGISFLFSIRIEAFYFPMLIFMLNPCYYLFALFGRITRKIK